MGLLRDSCCLVLNNREKNYFQVHAEIALIQVKIRKSRFERPAPQVPFAPGAAISPLGLRQFFSKAFNIRPQSLPYPFKLIKYGDDGRSILGPEGMVFIAAGY